MSLARFMRKSASLGSILPAVAGPTLGGLAGRAIGARYHAPDLGGALGAITGGTAGGLIKEKVEESQAVPTGAPYSLDASSADIPAWALQGAQLLQPMMKGAGVMDWILGEVPGGNVVQRGVAGGRQGGLAGGLEQAGRAFGGMSAGGVAGSLAGLGLGKGIEHFTGDVNVPMVNLPLHELLAGIGGSVGATKGLRHLSPENQGA